MKKYITNAAKLLLAIGITLPMVTMAQKNDKFSYGAPTYWRPYDKQSLYVFETTKADSAVKYEGMKIRFGAGFTQQFQNLKHENPLAINNTGTGANRLYPLQNGFMTAQANFFIDAQLADGIALNVTNYMSTRHHNEWWVKGGFIKFDKLPFKGKTWDDIMKVTTIKVGHFEVDYGDQHFRRPDAGNTIQAPFMEGNIMDAFATEIGGEITVQKDGLFGLVGVTSGMIKGNIDSTYKTAQDDNVKRNPSLYLKGGIDKTFGEGMRVRFTGSYYVNTSQAGSGLTLFWGDRGGSNYQNVMEKGVPGSLPAYTAIPWSGRFNPNFSKKISTYVLNSFVKVHGFEFFGTYENAKGRTKTETEDRKASQYAVEGVYRFGKSENLYVGARYNSVTANVGFTSGDIKINRTAFAAGWFMTSNILMKAEYVTQKYLDFPTSDYRAGGKFNGYVIEAVVGF
jgi:hypothetical protein